MIGARMTAIGTYVPDKKLTNFDLEKIVETNDEWIVSRTGIKERRISQENEFTSDLCISAVKDLMYRYNKNIVSISQKGIILSEAIEGTLLASPSMTAKWESYLRKIGEGKGSTEHFLNNIKKFLYTTIENATNQIDSMDSSIENFKKSKGLVDCPSCNEGMIEDKGKFYGCNEYRNGCKVTFPKKLAGKTLSESIIKTLCTKKETNKLKGFKGKKGKFDKKLTLNDNNEIKFKFD